MNVKLKSSIPHIFDRKKIKPSQNMVNNLFNTLASEVALRLKETNLNFENALELNSKTLETSLKIQDTKLIKNLYKTAIIHSKNNNILNFICDEEYLAIRNHSLDLVYSILGLNTINDLPGSLKQIHNCLKPKGLFIAAFWGEGTLMPLAESLAYADEKIMGGLYQRIFPYCDIKTLGSLMQRAGFTMPMADQEKIIKKYKSLDYLLKDIRSFNEKNILTTRPKNFTPRSVFKEAEKYLMKNYKNQSTFSIPFNIIFVMGWKS